MVRRLFIGAFVVVGVIVALYLQEAYRGINELAAADTWAYWSVDAAPYDGRLSGEGSGVFLYSPAAAQAMSLLGLLPWELVRDVWGFGQIVLLARHYAGDRWNTLSIPRGQSEAFNEKMRKA